MKVILNARNFGHIRSPYYALLQARGDAVVGMASDLQDPPELIPAFLERWEQGAKAVMGVKEQSDETLVMYSVRGAYYRLLDRIADIRIVRQATGFGLYDRLVIDQLRRLDDPYPYFRGLVAELGYETATVPYRQPKRRRGITSNNFYSLYDLAMLGIVNHSKVPLRLATICGFGMALLSFLIAVGYLVAKLLLLGRVQPRARADPDRVLLPLLGAARLRGHRGRVHRLHLHPGQEAAAGGRTGADQLVNSGHGVSVRSAPLDALRGLAVLAVLGVHLQPGGAGGPRTQAVLALWEAHGWVGVDVFFVLSGFLIGSLLIREQEQTGTVRVGRFLIRRGFKIYPLYYTMLLWTMLPLWMVGLPVPLRRSSSPRPSSSRITARHSTRSRGRSRSRSTSTCCSPARSGSREAANGRSACSRSPSALPSQSWLSAP